MSWQVKFFQDTDVDGIGTMRADYVDNDGNLLVTHSQEKIKNGDEQIAGPFIDQAKALLAKALEIKKQVDDRQALADLIAAKMNG